MKVQLSLVLFLICVAAGIETALEQSEFSINDVAQYMEDSLAQFQLELHQKSQRNKRRVKRELTVQDFIQTSGSTAFEVQVKNIEPIQSVPTLRTVELEPFSIENKTYLAVVNFQDAENNYNAMSSVYMLNESNNNEFEFLQNFPTSGGIDFEFTDLGTEKYAIFLDHIGRNWYGGSTYEKWFALNQFMPQEGEKPFQYRAKVRALGATAVKVFSRQGYPFFVTANSYMETGNRYHVKSTLHAKMPRGFELIQEFETQGAQDVEVVTIDNVRYILFVNYRDNSGNVDIYSSVYRERKNEQFDERGPFALYQRIKTHGGRDLEHFTFEGHHYLVVANEHTQIVSISNNIKSFEKNYNVDSVVYWWTGKIWVEWQRIPTQGAVKWTYFPSDTGEPMLVVANSKSQAVIYTYDPIRGFFKPTEMQGLTPFVGNDTYIPDVRSIMSFRLHNSTYLTVANYDERSRTGYNIFKVSFEYMPVAKLDPSILEIISKILTTMETELEEIKNTLSAVLSEVVNHVMTKSGDQNITGDIRIENVTITDTLEANELLYFTNVTVNPVEVLAKEAVHLQGLVEEQESKILRLQQRLDQAVKINEDVHITGKKTFIQEIVTSNIETETITLGGLVDGVDLGDLESRTWSKTKKQTVDGCYTFSDGIIAEENIEIDGKLNDVPVSSLMTTHTEQVIDGEKTFADDFKATTDVTMNNYTINGLHIPDDLIRLDSDNVISGKKVFSSLQFNDDVTVHGPLDEVDITEFNNFKMKTTTDQETSEVITFQNGFVVNSDTVVTGLVDNVNLSSLREDLDMFGLDQIITGNKTFQGVIVRESIDTEHINDFKIDEVVTVDTEQTINGEMTFTDDLTATGKLDTTSTVDGIDLSEDAVTLVGAEEITGSKIFRSADTFVQGHVNVAGTIDGVDFAWWRENAAMKDSDVRITGHKTFVNGMRVEDDLHSALINNISMSTLKTSLIPSEGEHQWSTPLQFQDVDVSNNSHVGGYVNGYRIPEDFVLLSANQKISGTKVFLRTVFMKAALNTTKQLNNESFTEFYNNAVKNNTDETIGGPIVFQNTVRFFNNVTANRVNNISIPDDIVTLNTFQEVNGRLSFANASLFTEEIATRIVHVNTTVNGIDLSVMESDALYKDRNQTVNGSKVFIGGISCQQNLSVAGLINGIDMKELINTTVRVSKKQVINGTITFENDVQMEEPITTPGTINGVDLQQLKDRVMKKTGNQTLPGDVTFVEHVTVRTMEMTDLTNMNGVNIHSFIDHAVKSNENITINGSLTYTSPLNSDHVEADFVDGVDTSDILLTSTNQTVYNHYTFSSVHTTNVRVEDSLAGVNITDVDKLALRVNVSQDVHAVYDFQKGIVVTGNTTVGDVNGINLTEFNERAVHLSEDENISGEKMLKTVSFDEVDFLGLLDGQNISQFLDDVMLISGDQELCGKKVFLGEVRTVSAELNDVIVEQKTNGYNVTEMDESAVKLEKRQDLRGSYTFRGDVHVTGTLWLDNLNGENVDSDYLVLTYSDQDVDGLKSFNGFHVDGDLSATGLVDGVDVNNLDKNRVTLRGNQSVGGEKIFRSTITTREQLLLPGNGTVNGLDLSEHLVLREGDSEILGRKSFNIVHVEGNLHAGTGVVNGVNLTEFDEQALRNEFDSAQTLAADQTFTKDLRVDGNITVIGTVNGVIIGGTKNYTADFNNAIENGLINLQAATDAVCLKTVKLMQVATAETVVQGIRKVTTVHLPNNSQIGEIDTTVVNDTVVFVSVARQLGSGCGPAFIFRCTLSMECAVLQTITTNAQSIEFFEHSSTHALFVQHSDTGNATVGCKTEPEIFVWSSLKGKYVGFHSLNVDLMESDLAPVLNSSAILSNYMGKNLGHYKKLLRESTVGIDAASLQAPIKVKKFKASKKDFVAVSAQEGGENFVDILNADDPKVKDIKKIQRLKVNKAQHVASGRLRNGKNLLAVSSSTNEDTKLYSLSEENGEFVFYQNLKVAATSVKIETVNDKSYLSYASPAKGVGICEWQGVAGFEDCHSIEITEASFVEAVTTPQGVYMVTGQNDVIVVYEIIFEGNYAQFSGEIC